MISRAGNLSEVERLNQRGGRTLSFVDLIKAGTLTSEMAGELAAVVESGASMLTAARLGGVGKSTALADLLSCLPLDEIIITLPDEDAAEKVAGDKAPGKKCCLVHEIGPGPYFAYLWGTTAARLIALSAVPKLRIASCLHADELPELYGILKNNGASESIVKSIGIILFIKKRGHERRVNEIHYSIGGGHVLRWRHDDGRGNFIKTGECPVPAARVEIFTELFQELHAGNICDFAEVRRKIVRAMKK